MRITVAYDLNPENTKEKAELLLPTNIAHFCQALTEQKHTATPVEVSGRIDEVIDKLINSKPDVIVKFKPKKDKNANNSCF